MRSPILIASSMSWVTKTIVLRSSLVQAQEVVLQALAGDRVDRAERLVHQHHRRVGGQRAGHADALVLAARELRRVALAVAPRGRGRRARAARARARGCGPCPSRAAAGTVAMLSLDRHVREQPDLLDHVADPAPQLGRLERRRTLLPSIVMSPSVIDDQPVDHLQRGGLAAARRADQHADLAGGDRDAEIVDRRLRAVP